MSLALATKGIECVRDIDLRPRCVQPIGVSVKTTPTRVAVRSDATLVGVSVGSSQSITVQARRTSITTTVRQKSQARVSVRCPE